MDDQGVGGKLLGRTMKFVNNVLSAKEREASNSIGGRELPLIWGPGVGKGKERVREGGVAATRARGEAESGESLSLAEKEKRERFREFGKELPKAWGVLEEGGVDTRGMGFGGSKFGGGSSSLKTAFGLKGPMTREDANGFYDVLRGCRRVVVIGVHGWFPGKFFLRLTQLSQVSMSFRRCYDSHCPWRGMLIGTSYFRDMANYHYEAHWNKLEIRQHDRAGAARVRKRA